MRNLIALPFLLAVFSLQAGPIDQWVWRNRLPCSPQFNSLTHGAGLWVASPDQVCLFLATSPDASIGTQSASAQTRSSRSAPTATASLSSAPRAAPGSPPMLTTGSMRPGPKLSISSFSAMAGLLVAIAPPSKSGAQPDGTNWTSSSLFAPTRFRPATPSGPPGSPWHALQFLRYHLPASLRSDEL